MATPGVKNKGKFDKTEGVQRSYTDSLNPSKQSETITFDDEWDGWRERAPARGSEHPEYAGLTLVKRSATRKEGMRAIVTLEYESDDEEANGGDPNDANPKRYELELVTSEEPILSHDRYKDLTDKERVALGNIANGNEFNGDDVAWENDVTSERGKECLAKIRKGITHYLEPGLCWVERYTTKSLGNIEIAKLGEVMNPPGNPPAPGDLRNYLYVGATAKNSDTGKSWDIERRWRLSAKGKWDPQLYGGGEA